MVDLIVKYTKQFQYFIFSGMVGLDIIFKFLKLNLQNNQKLVEFPIFGRLVPPGLSV